MGIPRLDSIRKRLESASAGPWVASPGVIGHVLSADNITVADCCSYDLDKEANAEFIANAPRDISDLLNTVSLLGRALQIIKEGAEGTHDHYHLIQKGFRDRAIEISEYALKEVGYV